MLDNYGRKLIYVAGWVVDDDYTSARYRCAHDYGLADSCPMCDVVIEDNDERKRAIRASQTPGLWDPETRRFYAVPPATTHPARRTDLVRPSARDHDGPIDGASPA